jgi:Excalibur calcium-binding domain
MKCCGGRLEDSTIRPQLIIVLSSCAALVIAPVAVSGTPVIYKNCTNFNKRYHHGVGRIGAHDKTKSATSEPVTNFLRSNRIYTLAMKYNRGLDRDHDGVACETH